MICSDIYPTPIQSFCFIRLIILIYIIINGSVAAFNYLLTIVSCFLSASIALLAVIFNFILAILSCFISTLIPLLVAIFDIKLFYLY